MIGVGTKVRQRSCGPQNCYEQSLDSYYKVITFQGNRNDFILQAYDKPLTPNIELLDEEIHPSNVYFHFQYDCIRRSIGLHLHVIDRLGGFPKILLSHFLSDQNSEPQKLRAAFCKPF